MPATPTPKPKSPNAGLSPVNTIPDAEWAKIVDAAKKEGNVTCYCWDFSTNRDTDWVTKAFKDTYGIEVELLGFSGTVSAERIKSEARAGKYIADVFAAVSSYHVGAGAMEGTGLLKRIDNLPALKDVKDPDAWLFDPILTLYTLVTPRHLTYPGSNYTYNSNLIPADRLPRKVQDLLDPWYKGKICDTDPLTYAGTDYMLWRHWRAYDYADWWPGFFWEYYNKGDRFFMGILGGPNNLVLGNCGISLSWRGQSAGNLKRTHTADKAAWVGQESFVPPMPVGISNDQGHSLLAKSPHPNAAMLFENWLYSKEGQEAWAKQGLGAAARRGIPFLVEEKYWPKVPVKSYWLPEDQWYAFEQYSYSNKAGVFKLVKQGMTKEAWLKWMKDTSMSFWGQYPPPPPPSGFFRVE